MRIIKDRTPNPRLRIERTLVRPPVTGYWSAHTHSRYSVNDAMPDVKAIVDKAASLGQGGIAITDHGNMAASVELYQAATKAGIAPFPGSELYFVPDLGQYKVDYANKNKKADRYHLGVMAYTTEGYENMVNLSTLSHRNFFHKPNTDFEMFASLAEEGRLSGLAVTTGCYYGYTAQLLIRRGEGAAKQWLATLSKWFPESVYVEVQNHHIDHTEHDGWNDNVLADALMGIADEMGLPMVLTQDSHYVEPEDKEDHEALKALIAFGPDPDEAVFPGDGFHMVDDQWMFDHHGEKRFKRGIEGLQDLLGKNTLTIPVLDSYSYSVPDVVPDPQRRMEERVLNSLHHHFDGMGKKVPQRYLDEAAKEFEVIGAADMAGYMMLVAKVTDYMRENGIVYQTRGSAAGSIVCWMLGISNVDPIKWDLRFERFLSKDRTKPPDIDLDIAHDRREELVAWLDVHFVANQIGTWAKYTLDEEEDEMGERKGSLRVRYFSSERRKAEARGEDPDAIEIPEEDMRMLSRLSDRNLYKGMGTNAAGIVLTSTKDEFERLVPMAYMPRAGGKSGYVTQYGKDEVEALGLVKLDVLGSKTLTVLQKTMANLDMSIEALEEIEFNDAPSFSLIRSGNTEGIFQLEGGSSKWGCKKLRPNHIKDVIAAMALFRPAAMNSGGTDSYIMRKHREQEVPDLHPLLKDVLGPTYGVLVYQEQVIDILRSLGMDPDSLTAFLKAVKSSNGSVETAGATIRSYMAWVIEKCEEQGVSQQDLDFLVDAIMGFAEYGFNRAHATVYGITAYRCAYLATHHPAAFHAGLLSVAAGSKKEAGYLRATKKRGVSIRRAMVNVSGVDYTVDRKYVNVIRKSLLAIDGVGEKTAEVIADLQPFRGMDDMVKRVPARPVTGGKNWDGTPESLNGVLGKLRDAGALEELIGEMA